MKVLFVYPRFERHADSNPELRRYVPMNEYLGSPSLGIAAIAAVTPGDVALEFRDDRVQSAAFETDADLVALSFFTPAATRAFELAAYFRGMGKRVVAGGIFSTMMPDLVAPHVDAVVVGEGETVWIQLLADLEAGELRPRYHGAPVDLAQLPPPRLDLYFSQEGPGFAPDDYPLQISRGCPLSCSACVLPESMGAAIRTYPLDQVWAQLTQIAGHGRRACLTEDTSWFPGPGRRLLEALAHRLRDSGAPLQVSYLGASMPQVLAAPSSFLSAIHEAGVNMLYLVGGFDPVSTRAFTGQDPRAYQRALDALRRAWDFGLEPYTSFLIGNDQDDEGTVDRMLELADRASLKKAEFAIFTPYPGTPAWRRLKAEGRIRTEQWSRYNDANVVFQPAHFSPEGLRDAYLTLWREFYRSRLAVVQELDLPGRTIQF